MSKLKECPFCGCEFISINKIKDTGNYWLECPECGIETKLFDTLADAVETWNKRSMQIIHCPECRYYRERNNDESFCEYHYMTVDDKYYCAEGKVK